MIRAMIGAMVGTMVGAAVWVGVGLLGYEIGFIAWGIGLAAGMGATIGAGDQDTAFNGVFAALIAILGIVGAKYITVAMLIDAEANDIVMNLGMEIDDNMMIEREADAIVEAKGPNAEDAYDESQPHGFDGDVWTAAEKQWQGRTAEEQYRLQEEARAEMEEFRALFADSVGEAGRWEAFKSSFGAYDALWFFLAAATAFKVGSGAADD